MRQLVLGNGRLLVGFDDHLRLRDLYFPCLGSANHLLGHWSRVGVWADAAFAWLDAKEGGWEASYGYRPRTMVARSTFRHPGLALEIILHQAVHYRESVYLQRFEVKNLTKAAREVRLFFHYDFHVLETEVGNTVFYDPELGALIHYHRDRYFLMAGRAGREGLYQYATGVKEFLGFEGTWRDAEDGVLAMNPICQGSVDSTFSLRARLGPGSRCTFHAWLAAGTRYKEVKALHELVQKGPERLLQETDEYWSTWLSQADLGPSPLPPPLRELYERSLLVMRAHCDSNRGGIVASSDFPPLDLARDHYGYVWPRDGALVAAAFDRAGYPDLAQAYAGFCAGVLTERGFLLHKYLPEGCAGSSWHPWILHGEPQFPIQEDETALVLWALGQHFDCHRDIEFITRMYPLIERAGRFLAAFRDKRTHLPLPSWDLWEERRGVFAWTASAVYGGLLAAAHLSRLLGKDREAARLHKAAVELQSAIARYFLDPTTGRFARQVVLSSDGRLTHDPTPDASLWGLAAFGAVGLADPAFIATMAWLEERLWVAGPIGGLARYAGDLYCAVTPDSPSHDSSGNPCPGNPWVVCTLWLARWYLARATVPADLERPLRLLEWVARAAGPAGILPEQVHPKTGAPLSVSPLTWSHSEYVNAVLDYTAAARRLAASPPAAAGEWEAAPDARLAPGV
ncbi:MAG: glycoside hydrolase family 15 protein [Bacillota bacterium]|nr:glycoside hydrolase family 15 protein [Bacillota bacterium]